MKPDLKQLTWLSGVSTWYRGRDEKLHVGSRDRLLVVGAGPQRGEPLDGKAGRRLADLLGLGYDDYLDRCDRLELVRRPCLSVIAEHDRAVKLRDGMCIEARYVLCVGAVPALGFGHGIGHGIGLWEALKIARGDGFQALWIPALDFRRYWWRVHSRRSVEKTLRQWHKRAERGR